MDGQPGILTILGIAIGLAMDALAVSIATGIALGVVSRRQTFRLAFHFGLFQFLMPLIGWLAGMLVERWIASFDHWVAFGLLAFVGGKMLYEAASGDEEARESTDPTRGATLILLSVATSIDALAVGLSLGVMNTPIWFPAIVIGVVCAALTTAGMHLGKLAGSHFGHRVEVVGGLVLIGIGVKILVEHLTA